MSSGAGVARPHVSSRAGDRGSVRDVHPRHEPPDPSPSSVPHTRTPTPGTPAALDDNSNRRAPSRSGERPAAAAALECGGLPPLSFRLTEEFRTAGMNHPRPRLRMGRTLLVFCTKSGGEPPHSKARCARNARYAVRADARCPTLDDTLNRHPRTLLARLGGAPMLSVRADVSGRGRGGRDRRAYVPPSPTRPVRRPAARARGTRPTPVRRVRR
jgi:hypothetical protein